MAISKIQHSTAVSTRPAESVSGTIGYFQHESALGAGDATKVTQEWLNDIVDESSNLITLSGLTPSSSSKRQWFDSVSALVNTRITQTTADSRYVLKSGDTMTGHLTLSGDPTTSLHSATKQYVDNTTVSLSGDTMTGLLVLSGDPVSNLGASTKQYVDNTTVSLSGDTMTGFLTLNADPINPLHAATKQYVDGMPKPSFYRLTWTDELDVSVAAFYNTWTTVKSFSITVPAGKTVMQVATVLNMYLSQYAGSIEMQLLYDGTVIDDDIINGTGSYSHNQKITFCPTINVTPGTHTLLIQAKQESNSGRAVMNAVQNPHGGAIQSVSRISLTYF